MNHHFGELGDIWKHLPLAEMLWVNPPRHYWETHAGSATYPLTESPARLHGVFRFLRVAAGDPDLADCAYYQALQIWPEQYPGSPALAVRALGPKAGYILCDIDPESVATLRSATVDLAAQVFEADGVGVITREAQSGRVDPGEVLVHIDPFDPHERFTAGSKTPIELTAWLAGGGYRVFYWYAFDSLERSGWAREEIASLAPGVELWCGEAVMPASFVYPDRSGLWGCGVVLANASEVERAACERLGQALERISAGDIAAGNVPDRLRFQMVS